MSFRSTRRLHRRRPVRRDRGRLLHQAARRRRGPGHQSRAARRDPLRRWSASGAEVGDDGALFSFLAGAKHSVVADPETDIDLVNGLLAGADAVVWSRGSWTRRAPRLRPRRDPSSPSSSDRHVDHAVRARWALARPSGDRVHPAGMVGWDRRPRPRVRQTGRRCSWAARSASSWPGRMPAPRSWRPGCGRSRTAKAS